MTSKKLRAVVAVAEEKGKVTRADVDKIYLNPNSARNALEYLVKNKVLKITEKVGVFECIGKNCQARLV